MRHESQELGPGFLTLAAYSALAVGLLFFRALRAGGPTYFFLIWNLLLAWMPWLLARAARATLRLGREGEGRKGAPEMRALGLGLALLWLLFFPNAPYLITDFVHLSPRPPVPLWYDIGMLTAFSGCGLFLGLGSLRVAHAELRAWLEGQGRREGLAWLPIASICALSGYGIYLGRFLRFNSWDALLHPLHLGRVVLRELLDPFGHPRPFVVTLLFGALILLSYLALGNIGPRARVRSGRGTPPECRKNDGTTSNFRTSFE